MRPLERSNLDALVRAISSWKRTDEGVHPTMFNRLLEALPDQDADNFFSGGEELWRP